MRVKGVHVQGLFGVFDHHIPLTSSERVTIIHGPNGYGKTVVLNMIAGLVRADYQIFERIPFSEFRLELEDESQYVVRQTGSSSADGKRLIEVIFIGPDGQVVQGRSGFATSKLPAALLQEIDLAVPSPFRLFRDKWLDDDDRVYSLSQIVDRFPEVAQLIPERLRVARVPPLSELLQVVFVETNRLRSEEERPDSSEGAIGSLWRKQLLKQHSDRSVYRVEENSADLVQRIQAVLAEYAKHAQDRDRTFPERLVRFAASEEVDERVLIERMAQLETKRKRLVTLGILDSEAGLGELTEQEVRRAREALTIYVSDVDEKLRVFDDLEQRIGTFRDILNQRLPYKKLVIDREQGVQVISQTGQNIRLRDLSSGEQHELVVLYELLFRTPPNGLVLVDEPEISLHVAWQSKFLEDLINILNVTNSYALIATHSPMIIGPKWDLTVPLSGPSTERAPHA